MEVINKIVKPTSSPTPIRAEVKQAMIAYLLNPEKHLPTDLGLIVEILYLESKGKPVEHLQKPYPSVWNMISEEATTWAGFSRRDPYVDVPKYPSGSILSDILYTFSMVSYSYLRRDDDGVLVGVEQFRKNLAAVIEAMPEIDTTKKQLESQPEEAAAA